MPAPVVVFVYNRADHAQTTLNHLRENILADKSDLYIYCDNAKNENAQKGVDAVRAMVDDFAKHSGFKNVTVIKAAQNKGLAASIIGGAGEILEKYGRIIVVEDDLITSKDFLTYMNNALDFYESNPNIWSVSGYTFPLKSLQNYPHDIYMSPRGNSWGWATWKDRFDKVDWDVSDFEEFIHNPARIKHFNEGGPDMTDMLSRQVHGKINSWAIRWCYQESKENMFTVYPKESRVRNIGCDNTGTNCVDSGLYDTTLTSGSGSCTFENLKPEPKIMREFRSMYDYSRLGGIKRALTRLFI